MTKDKALKLALEALEVANSCIDGYYIPKGKTHLPEIELAITAIKEALAQPEQHQDWCASLTQMLMSMPPKPAPCNCKPPQRTWVGLTLDERIELAEDVDWAAGAYCEYAEKIEAKLKELNT